MQLFTNMLNSDTLENKNLDSGQKRLLQTTNISKKKHEESERLPTATRRFPRIFQRKRKFWEYLKKFGKLKRNFSVLETALTSESYD